MTKKSDRTRKQLLDGELEDPSIRERRAVQVPPAPGATPGADHPSRCHAQAAEDPGEAQHGHQQRARAGAQLERTIAVDPSTAQTYRRHRKELKPWVEAAASSHLWRARLPAGLKPGPYTAEIAARDEYDRLHTTRVMFEVTC